MTRNGISGPGTELPGDIFCPACGHWHDPAIHPALPPLFPNLNAPDPAAYDAQPVTFTEPVSHTRAVGCTETLPAEETYPGRRSRMARINDQTVTTCPACLDELGTELEAEYRAAIERNRDRAQLARAGGRAILRYYATTGAPHAWTIALAHFPGTAVMDAEMAQYDRGVRALRDAGLNYTRGRWPISRAAFPAGATHPTRID